MCSVQEGTDDIAIPRPEISIERTCMKCKKIQAVVVTRVNDAFCRECFTVYIVHKFRATVGKSHLVRDGETILLAFSGGPASSTLLRLVQEGLSMRAHKRLRFIPSIVHIEETSILSSSADDRDPTSTDAVLTAMRSTGYPCYVSSLGQALDISGKDGSGEKKMASSQLCWDISTHEGLAEYRQVKHDERLREVINGMKSITAKEDFIRNLRNQLLAAIARRYNYGKVMLGETSTRLAVRILSDIGQGRGGQVSTDTSFADERYGDVMFVRPIRELTSKEVAMYNSLHQVEPVIIPTLTTKAIPGVSIDHLTESFVTGLQAEFPSTVSNITRTAGKLDSIEKSGPENTCAMCHSPLDTDVKEASALRAVEYSRILSKRGCSTEGASLEANEDVHRSLSTEECLNRDLIQSLCYGCRLTYRDLADISHCPNSVIDEAKSRANRQKMQDVIKDFIIDEATLSQ